MKTTSGSNLKGGSAIPETLPSVPDGYDFDEHDLVFKIDNTDGNNDIDVDLTLNYGSDERSFSDEVTSGFSATYRYSANENRVGDDCGVTIDSASNTIPSATLDAYTYGIDFESTTYNTEDPSVSGDVDASGPSELDDGEQSDWYELSGLEEDADQDFDFSINGSNEARFRFRFEYESVFPDNDGGRIGVKYDDTWYETVTSNPDDDKLKYNHVQVYSPEYGDYVSIDVVDPDDDYAGPARIYNEESDQWLALRLYNERGT